MHKFVVQEGLEVLEPTSVPSNIDESYEAGYNEGYQDGFLQLNDPNNKYQTGYKLGYARGTADLEKGGRFNPNTNQASELDQTIKDGYLYGYQQGICLNKIENIIYS